MRIVTHLGNREALVFAPPRGAFELTVFRAVFPPGALYGLDVETSYLTDLAQFDPDFELRLIQFATTGYAWVLDLADPPQRAAAIELLSDDRTRFCSHTPMDVLSVATRLGVDISGRNLDTRMLGSLTDPDLGAQRDLKALTARYLGNELTQADEELYGRFRAIWPGRRNAARSAVSSHGWSAIPIDDPTYLRYAGLDAIACRRLVPVLAPSAPTRLLAIETWLATQAVRIQLRGMAVDTQALTTLNEQAKAATSAAEQTITELTGLPARSPKIQGWLADHGVDWSSWVGALTEGGKPSLAKENVKLLAGYPLDEEGKRVTEALIEHKAHLDTLNKTNGILAHLDPNGIVHPSLNTVGAVTARMSSAGPNFQNFSKRDPRHRGLFVARPGQVFVTIDFDQVELRVVAALAGETKMIDAILAGQNLHQLTVDEIAAAGIEIEYDSAKITNFLIVYGGGATALKDQTGIPLDTSQAIIRAHRERYRAIAEYSYRLGQEREAIRTISGRRIPVTRNRKTGELRAYANVNYAVQSAARELLVDSWHRFGTEFGRAEQVWFPEHDELVLEVPESIVDKVISEVEQCMSFDFRGVPITASAVILKDENGVSRWMTAKRAEAIASGSINRSETP